MRTTNTATTGTKKLPQRLKATGFRPAVKALPQSFQAFTKNSKINSVERYNRYRRRDRYKSIYRDSLNNANRRERFLWEVWGQLVTEDVQLDSWATNRPQGNTAAGEHLYHAMLKPLHILHEHSEAISQEELEALPLTYSRIDNSIINKAKGDQLRSLKVVLDAPKDATFGDLLTRIQEGRGYTPGTFRGGQRLKAKLKQIHMLVLDVDGFTKYANGKIAKNSQGKPKQFYVQERKINRFCRHFGLVWHRTASFDKLRGIYKYRILVPLTHPVTDPMQFLRFAQMFNALLFRETGAYADPKATPNVAGLFYGSKDCEIEWPDQPRLYDLREAAAHWKFLLAKNHAAHKPEFDQSTLHDINAAPVILDNVKTNWHAYCESRGWVHGRVKDSGQYTDLWPIIAGLSTKLSQEELYELVESRFPDSDANDWDVEKVVGDLYERIGSIDKPYTMGTVTMMFRQELGKNFIGMSKFVPMLPQIKSQYKPKTFADGQMMARLRSSNSRITLVSTYFGAGKTYAMAGAVASDVHSSKLYKLIPSLDADSAKDYRGHEHNYLLRGRQNFRVYDKSQERWRDADPLIDYQFIQDNEGNTDLVKPPNTPTAGVLQRAYQNNYSNEAAHKMADMAVSGCSRNTQYDRQLKEAKHAENVVCTPESFVAQVRRNEEYDYAVMVDEATTINMLVANEYTATQISSAVRYLRGVQMPHSAELLTTLFKMHKHLAEDPNQWNYSAADLLEQLEEMLIDLNEVKQELESGRYMPEQESIKKLEESTRSIDPNRNPRKHINPGREEVFDRMPPNILEPIMHALEQVQQGHYNSTISVTKTGISVSHLNRQLRECLMNAHRIIVADATMTPERLGVMLGINPQDIEYIAQKKPQLYNERLIQVCMNNTHHKSRNEEAWDNIKAIKEEFDCGAVIDRIGIISETIKRLGIPSYGYGRDSRGSNKMKGVESLLILSTLVPNKTAIADQLRLELQAEPTEGQVNELLAYYTRAELDQAVGRTRASRHPEKEFIVVLVNNRPVEGFEQIDYRDADDDTEKRYKIQQILAAVNMLVKNDEKVTQTAIADIAGVSQSTISRHINEFWGDVDAVEFLRKCEEYSSIMDMGSERSLRGTKAHTIATANLELCQQDLDEDETDEAPTQPIDWLIWIHENIESEIEKTHTIMALPQTLKQQLKQIIYEE